MSTQLTRIGPLKCPVHKADFREGYPSEFEELVVHTLSKLNSTQSFLESTTGSSIGRRESRKIHFRRSTQEALKYRKENF